MKSNQRTTPLHRAVLEGDIRLVIRLLNENEAADWIVAPDKNGDYPLNLASARGHDVIVEALIQKHKKCEGRDYKAHHSRNEFSPLLAAVYWMFKVLDGSYNEQKESGNFNIGDPEQGYRGVIELLIEHYPEMTKITTTKGKHNALHLAIYALCDAMEASRKAGQKEIQQHLAREKIATLLIQKLIEAGVPLDEPNRKGLTPRKVAEMKGVLHIIFPGKMRPVPQVSPLSVEPAPKVKKGKETKETKTEKANSHSSIFDVLAELEDETETDYKISAEHKAVKRPNPLILFNEQYAKSILKRASGNKDVEKLEQSEKILLAHFGDKAIDQRTAKQIKKTLTVSEEVRRRFCCFKRKVFVMTVDDALLAGIQSRR